MLPSGHYLDPHAGTQPSSSSHRNSTEDQVPVDEILGYPIFKLIVVTCQKDGVPA